jgi:hypothetical protein
MKKDALPYWPAALNQKMAAAYRGLSVDTFTTVCPVRPIAFTNSTWGHRYLRQRLDEWLLSLDPNKPAGGIRLEDFFDATPKPKRRFGDALGGDNTTHQQRRRRRRSDPDAT